MNDGEPRFVFRPASETDLDAEEVDSFPRFQITAGDQLDARKADRFAVIRSNLRNAYTPAQPVTDRRMFAGRTKLMTTLIRLIGDFDLAEEAMHDAFASAVAG